jgi:dienelactone hydrolase
MTIALSALVVALVVAAWTPLRHNRVVVVALVSLITVGCVAVLFAEPRWMLVPLAAAAALALASVALRAARRPASRVGRMARAGTVVVTSLAAVVAALLAGGAAWALPTLALPHPSGPHGVGTTTIQWDTLAAEVLTAEPDDTRVLVAQLWYPTEESGPREAYVGSSAVSDAIAAQAGLPGFLLDGVVNGTTNAVSDASPADGVFPLVVFSPGLGGVRTQNSVWAEHLASNGYIVAAVDHPYDSAAVVLDDGTVIASTLTTTGDDETDQRRADDLASIRAGDLLATLDRLEEDWAFDGVASAGHSIGGAAAIIAASRDERVEAVIDLDGLPRGGRPTVPVLAIVAGGGTGSAESDARYDAALTEVLATCGTRVVVAGAQHLGFTDAALFLPPLPALIGSEGRTAALDVANRETRSFLDAALSDQGGC